MTQEQSTQAQANWLQQRVARWQDFEKRLEADRKRPGSDVTAARELVSGYRALASDLSLAKRTLPDGRLRRHLESLFVRGHGLIHSDSERLLSRWLRLYRSEVPDLMRQMRQPLFNTGLLFIVCILAGWLLVNQFPELASLFASPKMIEQVQGGKLWTEGIFNIMPSSFMSLSIMTNNIVVSLFAFALGALYGIGTLYIIGLNGLMLGGIFAFTGQHQLDGRLFEFVIAHGVVELSIICIAGAMGLRLGEALIRPGRRTRVAAFQQSVSDTGKLMMAVVPFLVIAGLIEGYISPNPDLGLPVKLLVGLVSGTLFWGLLLLGTAFRQRPSSTAT